MAVTGFTLLRELRENDPESCVTLVSNATIASASSPDNILAGGEGDALIISADVNGAAAVFEVSLPSTQDLSSGEFLTFLIGMGTTRISGMTCQVHSSGGYKEFTLLDIAQKSTWQSEFGQFSISSYVPFILQPNASSVGTVSGTFDASAVTKISFSFVRDSSLATNVGFNALHKVDRLVFTGGTSENPGSAQDFYEYVLDLFKDSAERYIFRLGVSSYQFPFRIAIGDNSTDTHWKAQFQSLLFTPSSGNAALRQWQYDDEEIGLFLELKATDSAAILQGLISSTSPYLLSGGNTGSGIFEGGVIRNASGIDSAADFLNLSLIECDSVTFNGGIQSGLIVRDSTGSWSLNWVESQTLENFQFIGSNDYYIRIGSDNVSNGATIDVSDVTFGTPGISHFLIDGVTGVTITTAAGASLTKTEINGGSATIQTPVVAYDFGVSGAPTGSSIAIFQSTGSNSLIANRNEFTLASGNNSGNSILVVNETIPADKPDSGFVRVLRDDGTEDRLPYSSWSGSTFTLDSATLPTTYSSGNGAYVGYVDVLGSSTGSESNELLYVSNRNCVLTVRLGSGANRIRDIRQALVKQAQDQVIPITGFFDSINITT